MKIAIIGGGITGLSAAYFLSKKKHQVIVFEKENVLGGLTACFKEEGWRWPLERFYHHFFSSDKEVLTVIKELDLEGNLNFKKPKTSVLVDDQIYPFDTIQSIFTFPKLTFFDKIRLGLVSTCMKLNPFWKPLEKITAYDFIITYMGKNNFNLIWKPLLEGKFGESASQIPASWFWTRIKKRSSSLGYLDGGLQTLLSALAEKIEENGGKIFLNHQVDKIKKINDKFEITTNQEKYPQGLDKVIAALSPQTVGKIAPSLIETKDIQSLKSLGTVALVAELKERFLTDGTYWLNINDSTFPFVAVVEHTNFINKKYYGGSVILYVGGYYPTSHQLFKQTDQEILESFIPYLAKINPSYDFKKQLKDFWVFKEQYAQPIPALNYSKSLPKTKTSTAGFYWGSLHHVYPQDRGINYGILLGKKIADEIKK